RNKVRPPFAWSARSLGQAASDHIRHRPSSGCHSFSSAGSPGLFRQGDGACECLSSRLADSVARVSARSGTRARHRASGDDVPETSKVGKVERTDLYWHYQDSFYPLLSIWPTAKVGDLDRKGQVWLPESGEVSG